jgi:WD40 repeat protein
VVIAPGNKARRGGPAHATLVVAICYSEVFGQIISAGVDEAISVWDIYTGQSVFEFRTTHGSPLTAACLDHRGKRLLTGAHDGTCCMWNFHNGAKMSEGKFPSRKKELVQLLYLPRTLQCVVGIGLDNTLTRWPDPNAPKNTQVLVQAEHRAGSEVTSLAAHDGIGVLVSGSSDGEIVVWYMDSALVSKRIEVPRTPRTGRRPGVTKMLFVDFHSSGLLLLLAGTDDGSVHFLRLSSGETVHSLFEIMPDPVVGIAVNREMINSSSASTTAEEDYSGSISTPRPTARGSGSSIGGGGERTRLMVCDCQSAAVLLDLSPLRSERNLVPTASVPPLHLPVLRQWEPHPGGTTTDLIALDRVDCFAASSDTGDITLWGARDGELKAKFAQRKSWPIQDPRTSAAQQREGHAAAAAAAAAAVAAGEGSNTSGVKVRSSASDTQLGSQSSADDDDNSDSTDGEEEEERLRSGGGQSSDTGSNYGRGGGGGRPGLARRISSMSNSSAVSASQDRRTRRRQRRLQRNGRAHHASSPHPAEEEPSYAETHPMTYLPRRDEHIHNMLKEHTLQLYQPARAGAHGVSGGHGTERHGKKGGGGPHGKLQLADMLNKLEADLKQQHSAAAAAAHDAAQGMHVYERYPGGGGGHHATGVSHSSTTHGASVHFTSTQHQSSSAYDDHHGPRMPGRPRIFTDDSADVFVHASGSQTARVGRHSQPPPALQQLHQQGSFRSARHADLVPSSSSSHSAFAPHTGSGATGAATSRVSFAQSGARAMHG